MISPPSSISLCAHSLGTQEKALLPACLVLQGSRECSAPALCPGWKTTPMYGKQAEHTLCSASHRLHADPGQSRCACLPGAATKRLKELSSVYWDRPGFEPRCVCGVSKRGLLLLTCVDSDLSCPCSLADCHSLLGNVPLCSFPLLYPNTDGLGFCACLKVLCTVDEEQAPLKWR